MKPVTGSSLARTDQCPASALAPAVQQVVDSHATERGVALHAYLANVNLMGREKALGSGFGTSNGWNERE